jgi:ADP-heptose:LPS heptosyltransferase
MKILGLMTNKHIGDAVILTAAAENYAAEHPDTRFRYYGEYPEVFQGNPLFIQNEEPKKIVGVTYSPYSQRSGNGGTCVEAFSRNLFGAMGHVAPPKLRTNRPSLYPTSAEIENAKVFFSGTILINAGWQECSQTKAWPHWGELVHLMPEETFVQIGAIGGRNFSIDVPGVVDMRGKTSLRQMIAAAAVCKAIVSPASAIVHMGAAFGRPTVCIIGAREAAKLTEYRNLVHMKNCCPNGIFTANRACMKFRIGDDDPRKCFHNTGVFPDCMAAITAEEVASKLKEVIDR